MCETHMCLSTGRVHQVAKYDHEASASHSMRHVAVVTSRNQSHKRMCQSRSIAMQNRVSSGFQWGVECYTW